MTRNLHKEYRKRIEYNNKILRLEAMKKLYVTLIDLAHTFITNKVERLNPN